MITVVTKCRELEALPQLSGMFHMRRTVSLVRRESYDHVDVVVMLTPGFVCYHVFSCAGVCVPIHTRRFHLASAERCDFSIGMAKRTDAALKLAALLKQMAICRLYFSEMASKDHVVSVPHSIYMSVKDILHEFILGSRRFPSSAH